MIAIGIGMIGIGVKTWAFVCLVIDKLIDVKLIQENEEFQNYVRIIKRVIVCRNVCRNGWINEK